MLEIELHVRLRICRDQDLQGFDFLITLWSTLICHVAALYGQLADGHLDGIATVLGLQGKNLTTVDDTD